MNFIAFVYFLTLLALLLQDFVKKETKDLDPEDYIGGDYHSVPKGTNNGILHFYRFLKNRTLTLTLIDSFNLSIGCTIQI